MQIPLDIEDLFASLSLDAPLTPLPSPPSSLAPPPPKPCPQLPKPGYAAPAKCIYSSPTRAGYSDDWSQAGHTSQGSPNSHVHALHKTRKPHSKKGTYAVFRSGTIGVLISWDQVVASTSGVRFALYQGYPTRAIALAAFEWALACGWTSADPSPSIAPISSSEAPLLITPLPAILPDIRDSVLAPRSPGNPWYVVYAGINPGIFASSIECALNVLGIASSLHKRVDTYANTHAKFWRAHKRGEVTMHRTHAG
ncbi:hypothetical protein B0H17DRAFT_1221755 [Mycena rosella]|uniref:Ribonuclease H1 N-terminal domain-containing protein n=1 Tax=Mycena rosella TaxID=1033263 RepID=A0AAD7FA00_MYCRO|nr:hypothetical protein B0H17DRAFT_1221755 [Mycena rosella]